MTEVIVPNLQKEKIIEFLSQDKRIDGRKSTDYREIIVEMGISKNAEASVRVKFGNTEVLAGVKLSLGAPYPDSPNEGTFMATAELLPMASNNFEAGKPSINAIELGRIIDRGIRESGLIDFEGLCMEKGEKVWQIFVDLVAINDDGNLIDVAGLAALIALGNAKFPVYNKKTDKVEYELSKNSLPLRKEALSFNMTFHKIGESIIADVTKEEEAISDFRLSIAVGDNKGEARITAMQKGKEKTINEKDMENILKLVEDKFSEMFPKIKDYVFS